MIIELKRTILAGHGRRTKDDGNSGKARWEEHQYSLQLLIVGEEMMTQTVPIAKFQNIFGVEDKLDQSKYRALRYTTANCKRAAVIVSRHKSLRPTG